MILAVTPNPSLDKTMVVPGFEPGQTYRVADVLCQAGGKGFNFARALKTLGEAVLVVAPLGGHNGRALRDLAQAEGLAFDGPDIAAETRTCLTIVDTARGRSTDLNEVGAALPPGTWDEVLRTVERHLARAVAVALSGSLMPGTPDGGLRRLVELGRRAGLPVLLDTHGPQLPLAIAGGPVLVKINQHEAAEVLGQGVGGLDEALAAAAAIQARGAEAVVITLGEVGAVGIDATGERFGWAAPAVASVCPVGSGDVLFAGVAAGLRRGEALGQALRRGVAAGAANTLRLGAGVFSLADAEALLPAVRELLKEKD